MKVISIITGIALLFGAFIETEYSYYYLLKWFVCGWSAYLVYYFNQKKLLTLAIVFGVYVILFNPLAPFYFDKTIWMLIDLFVAATFLLVAFMKEKVASISETNYVVDMYKEIKESDSDDLAKGYFIAKWPNWIRWLLFLPAAILVPIIISIIQRFLFLVFSGETGVWLEVVSAVILGGGFVYIGSIVAPQKQFLVALILLVLITGVSLLNLIATYQVESFNWVSLLSSVVLVISGVYVVYKIHKGEDLFED